MNSSLRHSNFTLHNLVGIFVSVTLELLSVES